MKKSLLALTIGSLFLGASSNALAEGEAYEPKYKIRVYTTDKLSTWKSSSVVKHPWMNVGSHYDCGVWSPDASTINYGQNFTQSRDCLQQQERQIDYYETDSFSNERRIANMRQEQRDITETESQGAVGEYRGWVAHESTFTEWTDAGTHYDVSIWSPVANEQESNFTQNRTHKQDMTRFEQKRELDTVTGDIRNVGEPVKHEQTDVRSESRDVVVASTSWSDVGDHYDCADWSPAPEEVDVYENYTQTRDCKQNQAKAWTYTADGAEIHSRAQNQVITETESQDAVGTRRDWVAHDSTFTGWVDYGSAHTYSTWSPAANEQMSNFTQTRSYKQPQERDEQKREIDAVSGEIQNTGSPVRHTQDDDRSESRSVETSVSEWTYRGAENTSELSPNDYMQTSDYTATRTYDDERSRTWTYKVDGSDIHSRVETEVLNSQIQEVPVTVTASNWSNTDRDTYTSWSPEIGEQIEDFSQSRTYTQNRERTWTYTAQWKSGPYVVGTRLENDVLANQNENRDVVVLLNEWEDDGDLFDCGEWSPKATEVSYGESFTQTRACKQKQVTTATYEASELIVDTKEVNKTISKEDTRTATGQKTTRWLCSDIKSLSGASGNGVYQVDVDGTAGPSAPKSAYCDMAGGGWTLYDNFSTVNITAGGSTIAYNYSEIIGGWSLGQAGYSSYLTTIDTEQYPIVTGYLQMFYGRETQGYIQRTMPSWAQAVRVDANHEWYSLYNVYTYGDQSYTVAPYERRSSYVFTGGGQVLTLKEYTSGIMWIDAVWVK